MDTKRNLERGQAIVLLAVTIVVLLGFTALAIDGGMVYADRRRAQNGADAAALAGALQRVNDASDAVVLEAITYSLQGNGYDMSNVRTNIHAGQDYSGEFFLITVEMTRTTRTSFLQVFYQGEMKNRVIAIARARRSQPVMPGMAIVGMGNCLRDGGSVINGEGGGNSGGARTFLGGIFINTPESAVPPATARCGLDPANNGHGIQAETGIISVGGYDYGGMGGISPLPVQTGINGGVPIDDPLSGMPEPTCSSSAVIDAGLAEYAVDKAGSINGGSAPSGKWAPGIYCINGDMHLAGQSYVSGDGVLLYFVNGGMDFNGNAYIKISAPNPSNCLPANPYTNAFSINLPAASDQSCTYPGIAIFSARSNASAIEVRGNGGNAIKGMIYAINGTLKASGGGSDPADAVLIGQAIVGAVDTRGGGDVKVTYNAGYTYWKPPEPASSAKPVHV